MRAFLFATISLAACSGAATGVDLLDTPLLTPIDCSTVSCTSADAPTIHGYRMFSEQNFTAMVDGWGRTRKFFVHIPGSYDVVDGVTQKIPVIFAFHGGDQTREAMIAGKWEDYFDQDYAFVIPLGEADPCDNPLGNGQTQWMHPTIGPSTSPTNPSCDPATQVVDGLGRTLTYWNASLPGAFTDVVFIEQLRQALLDRFPRLNADKVYATGFSSGGGMSLALACYRSQLFRGFSVVAKTFDTENTRGDYDADGIDDLDPQSLQATCGKTPLALTGYATGIPDPQLWGHEQGAILILGHPVAFDNTVTRPVAVFAGDQDTTHYGPDQVAATGLFIRDKNNLNNVMTVQDPFQDTSPGGAPSGDGATTERRTFRTAADTTREHSTFRRFYVTGSAGRSGGHAIPDAGECPPQGYTPMTCDYSYTDQTVVFFQDEADLNLNP